MDKKIQGKHTNLFQKIRYLSYDINDNIRIDVEKAAKTLEDASNPAGTLVLFSRLSLQLLSEVYINAGLGKNLPNSSLFSIINKLSSGNPVKKIEGLKIIPNEIATHLHFLRVRSNKVDHNDERINTTNDDAVNALNLFLRVLEWFYCDYNNGPKLESIYRKKTKLDILKERTIVEYVVSVLIIISIVSIFSFLYPILFPHYAKRVLILSDYNIKDSLSSKITNELNLKLRSSLSLLPYIETINNQLSSNDIIMNSKNSEILDNYSHDYLLRLKILNKEGDLDCSVLLRSLVGAEYETLYSKKYNCTSKNFKEREVVITSQLSECLIIENSKWKKLLTEESFKYFRAGMIDVLGRESDDILSAITNFRSSLEKDSSNSITFAELSNAQLLFGRYSEEKGKDRWLNLAKKNALKSIELDTTSYRAYSTLGRIYSVKGKVDSAIQYLKKAIKLNPKDLISYTELGEIYLYTLNDIDESIHFLTKANQIQPNNSDILTNLAVGYNFKKNYDKAILLLDEARSINPSSSHILINLGVTYERLGDFDKAIKYYNEILQFGYATDYADIAIEYLSTLLLIKKEYKLLDEKIKGYLYSNPSSYKLYYILGIAKKNMGIDKEAFDYWESGLREANILVSKNEYFLEPLIYTALFNARLNHPQQALQIINVGYEKNPNDPDIIMGKARVFSILNDKTNMLKWFSKAKRLTDYFDVSWLKTSIDFEPFINDNDLISVAMHSY